MYKIVCTFIAQILTKNGAFVAVTHSENSLSELIKHLPKVIHSLGIKVPEILSIQKLFRAFSLEKGKKLLVPYFKKIQVKKYNNKLIFTKKTLGKLKPYIRMKGHLLLKEVIDREPDALESALKDLMFHLAKEARSKNRLIFNKNDAVFICRRPAAPEKWPPKPIKKFCTACGKKLREKIIEGRRRNICTECGHIAYENPLPVASAIVMNGRKEILLVRRAHHPMKGMWCLPSGFIEADERIEDGAQRELQEETGIRGKVKRLISAETAHSYFYGY